MAHEGHDVVGVLSLTLWTNFGGEVKLFIIILITPARRILRIERWSLRTPHTNATIANPNLTP